MKCTQRDRPPIGSTWRRAVLLADAGLLVQIRYQRKQPVKEKTERRISKEEEEDKNNNQQQE